MNQILNNFNQNFQNLQGVTVGEKKKSLFKLFQQYSDDLREKSVLDSLVLLLKPQNHLEKIFLVDFFIYFRCFQDLYERFLKGDDIIISKVSKEKWFWEIFAKNVNPKFIIEVFPRISHILRLKILQKLQFVIDEEPADELFDVVEEHYGVFIANNLITACSAKKLKNIFLNQPVRLLPNQLELIYKKQPSLIPLHLAERSKLEENTNFMNLNPFFAFVAQNDPDMYCHLYEKYRFRTKLGKRTTKNFVIKKRDKIIEDPEKFVENLHSGRLVQTLGFAFAEIYPKLFPKKLPDSQKAQNFKLLKYYPKHKQYELLLQTFHQLYQRKFEDCPHLINENILKMVPEAPEREKLAKIKMAASTNNYFIRYLRPEQCLEEIKKNMAFARTRHEKMICVSALAHCCLINGTINLDILKFVVERFKNDVGDNQIRFLSILVDSSLDFSQLTQTHWDYFNRIIYRPDFRAVFHRPCIGIFYKYINFLYNTNQELEEHLIEFFQLYTFALHHLERGFSGKDPLRNFLVTLISLVPKMQPKTSIEDFDCKLVVACDRFNKSSRNINKINLLDHPRLINSTIKAANEELKIEENALKLAIKIFICSHEISEEIEKLRGLFWKKLSLYGNPFIIRWHLKHRCDVVIKHLEVFLNYCIMNRELNNDLKVWNQFKSSCNLYLQKKAIDLGQSTLDDLTSKQSQFYTISLSMLMTFEDYLKLVDSYTPSVFKVDLENSEASQKFQIQKYLLKGLNNIKQPLETLPLIFKFCKEDFVPCSLSPLYSAFYNAPSLQITKYIKDLSSTGAISTKKHSYHLAASLFDKNFATEVIRSCKLSQSTNIAFKYFIKNPSNDVWEIFTSKLNLNLDEATSELLAKTVVPFEYRTRYLPKIIATLSNLQHLKIIFNRLQPEIIAEIPLNDFKNILKKFTKIEEVNRIVSLYLIEDYTIEKFNLIFEFLRRFKTSSEFTYNPIVEFIFTFFTSYMNWSGENLKLVEDFRQQFQNVFNSIEAFQEHLIIDLLPLKCQNCQNFVNRIVQLHNDAVKKYGPIITESFSQVLQKTLKYFWPNEEYHFFYLLLQSRKFVEDLHLLIKLLPLDSEPEDVESLRLYEEILLELEESDVKSVQTLLHLYFKNHKASTNVENQK